MLALLLAALLAADTTPAAPPLEPNGPWVVEGSEGACILTRSYGPDSTKITVGLQPLFTTPKAEVIVLTHDPSTWQGKGDARVDLSSSESLVGTYSSYPISKERRLTRLSVPSTLLDGVKASTAMTISARALSASVRLVRTGAAFAAFETCQHALFKAWQVDPAALAPERVPVGLNVEETFTPDLYPMEAQRKNVQGRVIAVVDVNANGSVAGCRVVAPVAPVLDRVTCARAKRLRFKLGKDAAGQAARSPYLLPIRWILPDG